MGMDLQLFQTCARIQSQILAVYLASNDLQYVDSKLSLEGSCEA